VKERTGRQSRFYGQQKEVSMHDLRNDPNMPHGPMQDFYNDKVQWAGVAVILLLAAGLIFAGVYSGNETQMASNQSPTEIMGSPIPPTSAQP
jgi:hypothetical protein